MRLNGIQVKLLNLMIDGGLDVYEAAVKLGMGRTGAVQQLRRARERHDGIKTLYQLIAAYAVTRHVNGGEMQRVPDRLPKGRPTHGTYAERFDAMMISQRMTDMCETQYKCNVCGKAAVGGDLKITRIVETGVYGGITLPVFECEADACTGLMQPVFPQVTRE